MTENNEAREYSIKDLVLLSMFLPGMAQLAMGQRKKGLITLVISAILFVDIIVHTFLLAAPVFGAILAGAEPHVDERILDPLKSLIIVIGIVLLVWTWALVDTILTARRRKSQAGL